MTTENSNFAARRIYDPFARSLKPRGPLTRGRSLNIREYSYQTHLCQGIPTFTGTPSCGHHRKEVRTEPSGGQTERQLGKIRSTIAKPGVGEGLEKYNVLKTHKSARHPKVLTHKTPERVSSLPQVETSHSRPGGLPCTTPERSRPTRSARARAKKRAHHPHIAKRKRSTGGSPQLIRGYYPPTKNLRGPGA